MPQFLKNNRLKNEKGMTLLEIMIVLAILAGLIAVLAGQVNGQLKKARMKEAHIQIAEFGKALDLFYTDCGFYPSTDQGLHALMEAPSNCSNWGPDPYLKKLGKDPWNHEYIYESSGGNYTIKSLGSDGKEGGSGDAADITNND
jgi:general secretion pathway protein G